MGGTGALVQAGETRSTRIEALRAVAALGVLVFHVVILTEARGTTGLVRHLAFGGAFGVFLFFALTGYLLFTPFARTWARDGPPVDLRRYARNRALRILPLYYVVLVTLLVLREHGGDFDQWWRFATFTESFFSDTVNTVDGPMWSLAVELQFYFLLPLIVIVMARLGRGSMAVAAAVVALLGLASVAVWWVTVHEPAHPDPRWRYSLPATFFEFTPGMLIALLRVGLEQRPRRLAVPSDALLLAGIAIWLVAAYNARSSSLIVAPASLLVLAAVALPVREGLLLRALDLRVLGAIGLVSYSLYLWQFPIVDSLARHTDLGFGAMLPLALGVCLVVAVVSFAAVERPFLRLRTRWGPTLATPERDGGAAGVRPGAGAEASRRPRRSLRWRSRSS